MRVLISLGALILVFLVGAKTEWVSVSKAAQTTSNSAAQAEAALASNQVDERAYEAVVLGQTRADATSGELIDAAVTRGEISSEQGLLYGIYLACGDMRLPAQFRGQDLSELVKNVLWEPDVDWASLSPNVQQALHAFFVERAAQPGLKCATEVARLKSDPSVWWTQAMQPDLAGRDAAFRLATN